MGTRIDDGGAGGAWDAFDFGDAPADEPSLETASFDEPATDLPEVAAFDDASEAWTEPPANHEAPPASVEDTFGWPEHAQARAEVADFACTAEGDEAEPEPEADAGAASHAVVVGKGQGVLAALRASGIPDPDLPAAYGALVRDGQLQPSEFVRGTPVVQPGRTFEVNPRALDDDAAALGRRLIATEHRTRAAFDHAIAPAPVQAAPTAHESNPRWQFLERLQERERLQAALAQLPTGGPGDPRWEFAQAAVQAQQQAVAAETVSGNYDKVVLGPWESFKQKVRDDNAAVQASDNGALGIASKVVAVPRELGFGLIDSGLTLGRAVVGVTESVVQGTLAEDARRYVAPVSEHLAKMGHWSTWQLRLSAGNDDVKAMIGTDRVGIQHKVHGSTAAPLKVDDVTRLTHRWGDSELARPEHLLETNGPKIPLPLPGNLFGVPLKGLRAVPGVRQNLDGKGPPTPSLNFDLPLPLDSWKLSVELRQSGG